MTGWKLILIGVIIGALGTWVVRSNVASRNLKALQADLAIERERAARSAVLADSAQALLDRLDQTSSELDSAQSALRAARSGQQRALDGSREDARLAQSALDSAATLGDSLDAALDLAASHRARADDAETLLGTANAQIAGLSRLRLIADSARRVLQGQLDSTRVERDRWRDLAERGERVAEEAHRRPRFLGIPLPSITFGPGVSLDEGGVDVKPLQVTLGYGL